MGCNGGNYTTVFKRYAKKHAMYKEDDRPYTGTDGDCNVPTSNPATNFKTSGAVAVKPNSESALKAQLAIQPVSIAIQAD